MTLDPTAKVENPQPMLTLASHHDLPDAGKAPAQPSHGKANGFVKSNQHAPNALKHLQQSKGSFTPKKAMPQFLAKVKAHTKQKLANQHTKDDSHTDLHLLQLTAAKQGYTKSGPDKNRVIYSKRAPDNLGQVATLFPAHSGKSQPPKRLDADKLPKAPWKTVPGYKGPVPIEVANAGKTPSHSKPAAPAKHPAAKPSMVAKNHPAQPNHHGKKPVAAPKEIFIP